MVEPCSIELLQTTSTSASATATTSNGGTSTPTAGVEDDEDDIAADPAAENPMSPGIDHFANDPYNKPETIHTLKGRELWVFVIFYLIAVLSIVLMFEFFMPVLFNPNYPNDP